MNLNDLPKLNREEYKPLYAQLSDILSDYINEKGLSSGDPLPSEIELMRHYGVSRTTVRIAIQRLVTEGLIKKIQGKGAFVAPHMLKGFFSGIKSLEERFSEQGISVTNEFLEASVEYPTRHYLKELELPASSQTYKIKRFKKIGNKPLCIDIRIIPLDIVDLFPKKAFNESPAMEIMNSRPETEIHFVNHTIKVGALSDREAEITGVPVDTPVLIQFATYHNSAGKPMMSSKLTFIDEQVEICFKESKKNGHNEKLIKVTS
jgi:GntR family transcriptional regulator